MKKFLLVLLTVIVLMPIKVNAKTLRQYKDELDAIEQSYNENQENIARTEEEIADAKNRIAEIYGEIDTIEANMIEINKQIAILNEDILKKDKEIKDLAKYYQFSNGESAYLEYLFSATSITDFIYRLSITEQLSRYNDKLIKDMNNMITENKANIKSLQENEESLKVLQSELADKLVILGNQRQELGDEMITIQDELDAQRAIVKHYEDLGCEEDQEISTCGKESLPLGTKFYRPLDLGYITSEYGYRYDPFTGEYGSFHSGTDMSTYASCSSCHNVYSVATGVVGLVDYNWSMGNYIVIWHNINGNDYSSLYMHLDAQYVSEGDEVTKDTVIGYMGNTGSSTATHLHLTMVTCHLWKPGSYCYYPSDTANSRDYINYPSQFYVDWEDRTSYYD